MTSAIDNGHLIPTVRFEADAATAAQRVDCWRAHVAPALAVTLPDGVLPADWTVRTAGWNVGGTMVVVGHYGAQRLDRTERAIRADHVDHYVLHLNRTPHDIRVGIDQRAIQVAPGQLLLSDFARPKTFGAESGDLVSLFIPRDALDTLMPRQFDLHGVVLQGACSKILASHLQSLAGLLPRMTAAESPDAMRATMQLLAASLAPSADSLGLARPTLEGTLHRQICKFVEDNLTQEDLGAESICAHFRISRSTLYRLFESAGGVANFLKERRLIRIHGLLASQTQRHYMGRIAEDHGFKSATHFSRAFREKFGYSPREAKAGQIQVLSAAAGAGSMPIAGVSSIGGWLSTLSATPAMQRAPIAPALH